MSRRRSNTPFGARLRHARGASGLSLSALARRTGISDSSLSRFESDAASPSFDDVCLISAATGWPLLFFATGRPRTDDDPRDLVSQLAFWGLRDLDAADSGLIGESRAFEPLVLQAVGQHRPTARIIEAIPGLLLRQRFSVDAFDAKPVALKRLGWLCDVAEWIGGELDPTWAEPDARASVQVLRDRAWNARPGGRAPEADEWDTLGIPITAQAKAILLKSTDPELPQLTRKWKVIFRCSLDRFLQRAKANLQEHLH